MNLDTIRIFRMSEESQNTRMYFDLKEKPDTERNSVYMLRRILKIFTLTIFVSIFANKSLKNKKR